MSAASVFNLAAGLLLAPLLVGVINRVKAKFGGRNGKPLLQLYYDLYKLLQKGATYSQTTTWVFRAGPLIFLVSTLAAATLVPFGGAPAVVFFPGDVFLFAYLLGLGRMFTILAALDTGSPFEGMGASREAAFSALVEPSLILGLLVFVKGTGEMSLSGMFATDSIMDWAHAGPVLALVVLSLFIVVLVENCRIPFDDPNTHLELTMIHEVMVLDHGGPDFGFIQYAAALKLWVMLSLLVNVAITATFNSFWFDELLSLAAMFVAAVAVGVVESVMARLRLLRIPLVLGVAVALSALALVLMWR